MNYLSFFRNRISISPLFKVSSLSLIFSLIIFLIMKQKNFDSFLSSKSKDLPTIDLDTILVKSLLVIPKKVTPSISILGNIEFVEKVDIVSKTAGNIKTLHVREGDAVTENQVLVQMDTLQLELEKRKQESGLNSSLSSLKLSKEKYYKAREAIEIKFLELEKRKTIVKEAEAELNKSKSTFEGKEIMFQEGGISKEEFEKFQTALIASEAKYRISLKEWEMAQVGFRIQDLKDAGIPIPNNQTSIREAFIDLNTKIDKAEVEVAESRVEATRAELKSTEELLKAATIKSPINGIVAYVNKHAGEYINPGGVTSSEQAILNLVGIHFVYAKFSIPEAEMPKVKKGNSVDFKVDNYPEELFKGKIDLINPMIDPKTHTRDVKTKIENNEKKFNPGMFVRGTIYTGEPNINLLIPRESVIPIENDKGWVFEIKNEKVFRKEVKLGKEIEGSIIVLEGLDPNSTIALEKLTQLKDGMRVKPILGESNI